MAFSEQGYAQQFFERLPFDNIWILGNDLNNIQIDFSESSPMVGLVNTPINFDNTNAIICDSEGALLMYSNGFQVLNGSHEYLANGFRINEQYDYTNDWLETGNRISQGMIILPQTTDSNSYHLFYTEPIYFTDTEGQLTASANNLYYAEVNFSESESGRITDKDFLLVNDTLDVGKITACRHGNGRDWWVFVANLNANQYHRILITNQGIENSGIISDGTGMRQTLGQLHFTPDGTKLVNAGLPEISEYDVAVYDFDRCTGEITNAYISTFISDSITLTGGMAISENSRFIYTTEQYEVYQYDLFADDFRNSRTLIERWDGYFNGDNPDFFWATFGLSQLAPNGKIYIATPGSGLQYHIIHNPNKRGTASNFEQRGLPFTQWNFRSIPNLPYYGLGPWDGSPCDTLGIDNPVPEARYEHTQDSSALQIEFFDASHYAYEWSWDFGDGSELDTVQHPVHTFAEEGTYQVCIQVSNVTGQDVYCEDIYVGVVNTNTPLRQEAKIRTFPIPVGTGPLTFEVELPEGSLASDLSLRLYNAQGQQIVEQVLNPTGPVWRIQIDMARWPRGVYLYELVGTVGVIASGRVVK